MQVVWSDAPGMLVGFALRCAKPDHPAQLGTHKTVTARFWPWLSDSQGHMLALSFRQLRADSGLGFLETCSRLLGQVNFPLGRAQGFRCLQILGRHVTEFEHARALKFDAI